MRETMKGGSMLKGRYLLSVFCLHDGYRTMKEKKRERKEEDKEEREKKKEQKRKSKKERAKKKEQRGEIL